MQNGPLGEEGEGAWLQLFTHVKCPIRLKSLFIVGFEAPLAAATACMTDEMKHHFLILMDLGEQRNLGLFSCV